MNETWTNVSNDQDKLRFDVYRWIPTAMTLATIVSYDLFRVELNIEEPNCYSCVSS